MAHDVDNFDSGSAPDAHGETPQTRSSEPGGDVHYSLEVEGIGTELPVTFVQLYERLGAVPQATFRARVPDHAHLDGGELLGGEARLTIERGDARRSFQGIVRHASLDEDRDGTYVTLEVVPALWLATQSVDFRIYQDLTVPELIERLIPELLSSRPQGVRNEVTRKYEKHEYLVQYHESHLEFLSRLCDEEGIWFYFDHDSGDHEVLVLGDSNEKRPPVSHGGAIRFASSENLAIAGEAVLAVSHDESLGVENVVVSGYDWSNPSLSIKEVDEPAKHSSSAFEVHDHFHAVRHHRYEESAGQYKKHTAGAQAAMQKERLHLTRHRWTVRTTVVAARAGHALEITDADRHDGRYFIVGVSATGRAGSHGGNYDNELEMIPESVSYRAPLPDRRIARGPETATVVGPDGDEIHTDQHGRVKVQFHWDRLGEKNEHSSAWLRVQQNWAGPGWGFVFIPRIGMEVIVQFLGGDPDRPIVTGCLYNGENRTPYKLDDEKTRSVLRTWSTPKTGGYNELSFEDKAGKEIFYMRAERDLVQEVLHDRDVDVGNDERIHIHANRESEIDGKERVEVHGQRDKIQHAVEKEVFHDRFESRYEKERKENYNATHVEHVAGQRTVTYSRASHPAHLETYASRGYRCIMSEGAPWAVVDPARANVIGISGEDGLVSISAQSQVEFYISDESSQMIFRPQTIKIKAGQITLEAKEEVKLQCGESSISVKKSGLSMLAQGASFKLGAITSLVSNAVSVLAAVIARGGKPTWD